MAKRATTVQSQTNLPAVRLHRATLSTPKRAYRNTDIHPFSILYLWLSNHISLKFHSYIFESSILYLWFVKHISLKKRSYSLENRIRHHSKNALLPLWNTSLIIGKRSFSIRFYSFLGRKSLHTAFGNERKWSKKPLLRPFESWKDSRNKKRNCPIGRKQSLFNAEKWTKNEKITKLKHRHVLMQNKFQYDNNT